MDAAQNLLKKQSWENKEKEPRWYKKRKAEKAPLAAREHVTTQPDFYYRRKDDSKGAGTSAGEGWRRSGDGRAGGASEVTFVVSKGVRNVGLLVGFRTEKAKYRKTTKKERAPGKIFKVEPSNLTTSLEKTPHRNKPNVKAEKKTARTRKKEHGQKKTIKCSTDVKPLRHHSYFRKKKPQIALWGSTETAISRSHRRDTK